jgi:BirA family biotin operon repressor/biotin-[acetyl-CoA-carboxylase] ligase
VSRWRIERLPETGSTNADVAAAARAGASEGLVVAADHQTAGRGRLGRSWETPRGSGLAVSFLLRPAGVPTHRWPWLPLLAGVVVVEALRIHPGVEAALKWPNDVLLDGVKLAGILAERVETGAGPAAVVGVGVNVSAAPEGATSLAAHTGRSVDPEAVLAALVDRLGARYGSWRQRDGDPDAWLAAAYAGLCDTLGHEVRAELPGGAGVEGRAVDVDATGRLVVLTATGAVAVGAGDVVHLRPVHD